MPPTRVANTSGAMIILIRRRNSVAIRLILAAISTQLSGNGVSVADFVSDATSERGVPECSRCGMGARRLALIATHNPCSCTIFVPGLHRSSPMERKKRQEEDRHERE